MIINNSSTVFFEKSNPTNSSFFTGSLNFNNLNYDPLVTGYAVIIWDKLPDWLGAGPCSKEQFMALTQKNFLALSGIEDLQLETQEYQYGFNNNAYNTAVGITKNNTEFTLTHKEFSGSPIKNSYQFWVTSIFDPETGIATYPLIADENENYFSAKNHTGSLLYVVLRPDVTNIGQNNIEFAAYFTQVMPKKVPLSHFEYQQGTRDHVQIEIPFSAVMHIGPKVDAFAAEKLKESHDYSIGGLYNPASADIEGIGSTLVDSKLQDKLLEITNGKR